MILVIAWWCVVAQVGVSRAKSDTFTFHGVHHDRLPLAPTFRYTSFLSFDPKSDKLYFDYQVLVATKTWSKSLAAIDTTTNKIQLLSDISPADVQSRCYAIDHDNKHIYSGGTGGVYRYDMDTLLHTQVGANDLDVWALYYHRALYIRTAIAAGPIWYILHNNTYTIFEEFKGLNCISFYITDDDDMYFSTSQGLFRKRLGVPGGDSINGFPNELSYSAQFDTDSKGRVFIMSNTAVYSVNNETLDVDRLFPVKIGCALTFDDVDDMIYSTWSEGISILLPSNKSSASLKPLLSSTSILLSVAFLVYLK